MIKDMPKKATNIQVKTSADGPLALSDNQVALVFDASKEGSLSSSGKTLLVASSHGAQKISETSDIRYSVNVMRPIGLTPEELKAILANRKS